MKKRIVTSILAAGMALTLLFSACGGEKTPTPDDNGKDAVLEAMLKDDGTLQGEDVTDENGAVQHRNFTTEDGKMGQIDYTDGIVSGYQTYQLNENGQRIAEANYDADAVLQNRSEMTYDKAQHLLSKNVYDGKGVKTAALQYEYDDNGRQTKETYYGPNDTLQYFAVSAYDSNGNIILKTTYGADRKETSRVTWTYAKDGTREVKVYTNNVITAAYRYAANGAELYRETYEEGKLVSTVERSEDNEVIKETYYDKDGNVIDAPAD